MTYENGPQAHSFFPGHSWAKIGKEIFCEPGYSGCYSSMLLTIKPTGFHPENLAAATLAINSILRAIPDDTEGRSLAFLTTRRGILLAWVVHDPETASKITAHDDDETVAAALGIEMT